MSIVSLADLLWLPRIVCSDSLLSSNQAYLAGLIVSGGGHRTPCPKCGGMVDVTDFLT